MCAQSAIGRPAVYWAAGALGWLLAWAGVALVVCPSTLAATHGPDILDVQSDPDGGLRAVATLHLPVPPSVVQQVLTDYEGWADLFGVQMRLARVDRQPDRVVTDIYIRHPILPGERRLMCENRVPPGGGLVTRILEGDFKRYERVWKLAPDGSDATKAEFSLVVDVETMAPDWLVALELKRQLEKHFRILRATTAARATSH
ncbi:MAG: SRPBCC family protein [Nitrospiraceae bacterium]